MGIDNDPFFFSQAIESDNCDRFINNMKDESKSMEQMKLDLVELPECCKRVRVNGSLRPSLTQLGTSNVTWLDLLQKVSLNKMTSTIKKHFHLFIEKITQNYNGFIRSL